MNHNITYIKYEEKDFEVIEIKYKNYAPEYLVKNKNKDFGEIKVHSLETAICYCKQYQINKNSKNGN